MGDIFENQAAHLSGPAMGGFAITPSDATVFGQPSRAIYVGGAGTLAVEMVSGGVVTFAGVPGGTVLPVRAVRVLSGTTASALVGLY